MVMNIETSEQLIEFCRHLQKCKYIAVDTEFLRERTYYPILCLVQVATPEKAACIDALAKLDLTPLFDVLKNPKILKVFHSCRQDIEIFYDLMGRVPTPLFDTQVGAMVCGLGENVSYHNLVEHFLGIDIDKASRVSDWSKRPLTQEQLEYAICDVTYLIEIYPKMIALLKSTKRTTWVSEEMSALENPNLYFTDPQDAWLRVKPMSNRPKYLAVLKALCAWREEKAKLKNRPRRYILKDEVVLQLAALAPTSMDDFDRLRNSDGMKDSWKNAITAVVKKAIESEICPTRERPVGLSLEQQGLQAVLRLLLDVVSANAKVASKLIATTEDLNKLVLDSNADIPALTGWRREIFGQAALDLKAGKIGLFFNPASKRAEIVELSKK